MTTMTTPPSPPQHKKRSISIVTWLLAGVLVIVVLAVALPFAYIHFLSGDAPPPLTLSSGSASAVAPSSTAADGASGGGASSATASLNGTWTVAPGSQAGYRVSEVLVGQSTEAVGRTTEVTGTATIADNKLTETKMTVDLTSVSSDKSERDQQFQSRIMNTSQFPTATFTLTKPIDLSSLPTNGSAGSTTATGDLTLHGVTKSVAIPLQVKLDGNNIAVSGSLSLHLSDWNIANPSAGPAKVGDDGTLEFLVNLTKS